MPTILILILCGVGSLAVSILVGVIVLAAGKKTRFTEFATAFAAGSLLASAFYDLLPEALEEGVFDTHVIMLCAMLGLVFFFLFEGFVHWFHKHAHSESEIKEHDGHAHKPINAMVTIGDTIHNVFDGLAIAAAFLVSNGVGFVTCLAILAHEIPQEIGDFAMMREAGAGKKKIIILNAVSGLANLAAAIAFYYIGDMAEMSFGIPLAVVAGFFIYISATDIIPTIHTEKSKRVAAVKMLCLILGAAVLCGIMALLHH